MAAYYPATWSQSLLLLACVACACADDTQDSAGDTDGSTTATTEASTSEASSTFSTGSTGEDGSSTSADTTGSDADTGIATTPPMTSEGSGSSTSDNESSSSEGSTTGGQSVTVEVTYEFVAKRAGVPLDCEAAGASWVDVAVFDQEDPDNAMFDMEDVSCDDTVISLGPLPIGNYRIDVVAFDQALWHGTTKPFAIDGTLDPVEIIVPLAQVASP